MKPLTALTASLLLATSLAGAQAQSANGAMYEVTITNITRGAFFTPILVASHRLGVNLFALGQPASDELAVLAEGGDIVPLEPGLAAFLVGAGRQADLLVLEGSHDLLVRSREPQPRLRAIAFGEGFLRVGNGQVALSREGAWLDLPLLPTVSLEGRRGVSEHLLRQRLSSDGRVLLRIQTAP